jgi:hypothetical protein
MLRGVIFKIHRYCDRYDKNKDALLWWLLNIEFTVVFARIQKNNSNKEHESCSSIRFVGSISPACDRRFEFTVLSIFCVSASMIYVHQYLPGSSPTWTHHGKKTLVLNFTVRVQCRLSSLQEDFHVNT